MNFKKILLQILENNQFYHIYNRGNNKQDIFLEDDNYLHFLKLLKKHIIPVARVYSYCLLKNHFHLLIEIKENVENPSQKFSNLFNAYSKAFNKRYNRTGSLFQRPFKRIKIDSEEYLKSIIVYIHVNPVLHSISKDFIHYKYSSYKSILSNKNTDLERIEIIELFEDIANFEFVHLQRKVIHDEKMNVLTLE